MESSQGSLCRRVVDRVAAGGAGGPRYLVACMCALASEAVQADRSGVEHCPEWEDGNFPVWLACGKLVLTRACGRVGRTLGAERSEYLYC